MSKLIIVISGGTITEEQNLSKIILCEYLNKKLRTDRFNLVKIGREISLVDSFKNNEEIITDYPNDNYDRLCNAHSFKLYTFSDAIKEMCMQLFGLDRYQCYGSASDKNTATHLSWNDLLDPIRDKHKRPRRGAGGVKLANGAMNSKEILDVFENDIIKSMDSSARGRSLFNLIEKEAFKLSVVTGAENSSEITIASEIGGRSIKILNNSHADEPLPLGEFSLCIDSINSKKLKPKIHEWLWERRLV